MNTRATQLHRVGEQIEFQTTVDSTPLTLQDIRQALQQAGLGRLFLLTDEINLLLADYQRCQL